MKEDLPALLEHLRDSETDLEAAIAESKLSTAARRRRCRS